MRTPTSLRLRSTASESPAKVPPQPGRRVVLKNGLLGDQSQQVCVLRQQLVEPSLAVVSGLAGLSRTQPRPADAESMPSQAQPAQSRHAPSLDNLRADQVCC